MRTGTILLTSQETDACTGRDSEPTLPAFAGADTAALAATAVREMRTGAARWAVRMRAEPAANALPRPDTAGCEVCIACILAAETLRMSPTARMRDALTSFFWGNGPPCPPGGQAVSQTQRRATRRLILQTER